MVRDDMHDQRRAMPFWFLDEEGDPIAERGFSGGRSTQVGQLHRSCFRQRSMGGCGYEIVCACRLGGATSL